MNEVANMNCIQLRDKRREARLTGFVVCAKAEIRRTRLSDIERGYVVPTEDEVARIEAAIDSLREARKAMERAAVEIGWPVATI
jgi:hypothetical protein